MKFVLITGMSGAGKSIAANFLEDLGYYCVDNLPSELLSKFAEICYQSDGKFEKVAFVVDARNPDISDDILTELDVFEKYDLEVSDSNIDKIEKDIHQEFGSVIDEEGIMVSGDRKGCVNWFK